MIGESTLRRALRRQHRSENRAEGDETDIEAVLEFAWLSSGNGCSDEGVAVRDQGCSRYCCCDDGGRAGIAFVPARVAVLGLGAALRAFDGAPLDTS